MARLLLGALVLLAGAAPLPSAADDQSTLRAREAGAALARGNVDQAIALYTEALDDKTLPNERRATILNDRGVAHARRQSTKEAIDDFNRAIQLYPEYAAVYNNRGNVLLGVGAVREAIKDFDRALVLAPGYAAAFTNRAGAHMKLGQVDRAIADYTKAIALVPASPAALTGRGRAHLAAHRPHGAIRDFTRAVTLDARFGAAYRGRAEAKMAIERYDEAIEDFSRAIAFEPRNAELYPLRGRGLPGGRQRRLRDQGLRNGHRARARKRPGATWRAGFAYAKAEAYEDALNDFARAIELEPRSPKAFAYRAWTYRQQQQPELGLKDVERALQLDANSAEAHWARGEINEALGRAELAIADLHKALSFDPRLEGGDPRAGAAGRQAPAPKSPRWPMPAWSAGACSTRGGSSLPATSGSRASRSTSRCWARASRASSSGTSRRRRSRASACCAFTPARSMARADPRRWSRSPSSICRPIRCWAWRRSAAAAGWRS